MKYQLPDEMEKRRTVAKENDIFLVYKFTEDDTDIDSMSSLSYPTTEKKII